MSLSDRTENRTLASQRSKMRLALETLLAQVLQEDERLHKVFTDVCLAAQLRHVVSKALTSLDIDEGLAKYTVTGGE